MGHITAPNGQRSTSQLAMNVNGTQNTAIIRSAPARLTMKWQLVTVRMRRHVTTDSITIPFPATEMTITNE